MKTAIYIEDGTVQLVLSPENDFEKNALNSFQKKPFEAKIFSGTFYDCRGGWIRQRETIQIPHCPESEEHSLILRISVDSGKEQL